MVSESDMDMLMYILCDDKYKHLNQGDTVTWKPEKWEIKDRNETLEDMIDNNADILETKLNEWIEKGKNYPLIMKRFNNFL